MRVGVWVWVGVRVRSARVGVVGWLRSGVGVRVRCSGRGRGFQALGVEDSEACPLLRRQCSTDSMNSLSLCLTPPHRLPSAPAPPSAASLPCIVVTIAALTLLPQDNAVESILA